VEPERVPELLAGARAGDAASWEALYGVVAGWVRAVARGLGLGRDDLLDVNQVVCLRLVGHLDRLRVPEALQGWVVTVTRHECYRVLRQRQHLAGAELPDVEDRSAPDVDDRLLRTERQRELAAALVRLSADCRRLLGLVAAEPPLSYAAIGEVLGRPVGSIGPTRQRCLGQLRALLEAGPADPAAGRRPGGGRPAARRSGAVRDLRARGGAAVERGKRR